MKEKKLLSTHPAVIAVWAALIAVVTLVPAFPIIGTGATFSVNAALIPLAGIFLPSVRPSAPSSVNSSRPTPCFSARCSS